MPKLGQSAATARAGIAVTNAYDSLHRRWAVGRFGDANTLVNYGCDGASRLLEVTNGVNRASYSYTANSSLVSQLDFKQSGNSRMTTTKSFDNLNRLTQISSTPSVDPAVVFNYSNNIVNQRTAITNADGSSSSFHGTPDGATQVRKVGERGWRRFTALRPRCHRNPRRFYQDRKSVV